MESITRKGRDVLWALHVLGTRWRLATVLSFTAKQDELFCLVLNVLIEERPYHLLLLHLRSVERVEILTVFVQTVYPEQTGVGVGVLAMGTSHSSTIAGYSPAERV